MRLFRWLATHRRTPDALPPGEDATTGSGEAVLVVRYSDYPEWDAQPLTDDPWRRHRGDRLRLAFQATPGADWQEPRIVEQSPSAFGDDVRLKYELRVPATPPPVPGRCPRTPR